MTTAPYFSLPPSLYPLLLSSINLFISVTPLLSYGTTVYGIHKLGLSLGFSLDICATMLMAATLRICYYFVEPFEPTLLRQLINMVFIQVVLLAVGLRYRPAPEPAIPLHNVPKRTRANSTARELQQLRLRRAGSVTSSTDRLPEDEPVLEPMPPSGIPELLAEFREPAPAPPAVATLSRVPHHLHTAGHYCQLLHKLARACLVAFIRMFDVHYRRPYRFWQWLEEARYWEFLAGFAAAAMVLTAAFRQFAWFGTVVGTVGLFIELLLPLPQILMLQRLRLVENFKVVLLLLWLGGDCLKLSYLMYGTDNVGPLFVVFALFQMSLDVVIAGQWWIYRQVEE